MRQLERLAEFAGRGQVRSAAKIDEVALAIQGQVFVGRNALDDLGFVLFADAAERTRRPCRAPRPRARCLSSRSTISFMRLSMVSRSASVKGSSRAKVVVEPVLDGRADRHLRVGPEFLDGFGEHMRGIVPQQLDAVVRVASHDLDRRVCLDVAGQVPQLAIDAHGDGVTRQALANAGGYFAPWVAASNCLSEPSGKVIFGMLAYELDGAYCTRIASRKVRVQSAPNTEFDERTAGLYPPDHHDDLESGKHDEIVTRFRRSRTATCISGTSCRSA